MAKTRNHSIRFEESDYEFISKREGLKTAQSILNFLLKEYLKLYKVEKKSVFDIKEFQAESNNLPDISLNPEDYKPEPFDHYLNPPIKKVIFRSAEQWHELKRGCDSIEEWNEVKQQIIDAENLSPKQKQIIINTP